MGSTQRAAWTVPAAGLAIGALLLGGCTPSCPLAGQRAMMQTELFFGRSVPGGGQVGDAAWSGFAAEVLTAAFPDGFTAYAALGQWRDLRDGRVVREPSTVVQAVGNPAAATIGSVTEAYRTRFHQVSVGVVTQRVCAAF